MRPPESSPVIPWLCYLLGPRFPSVPGGRFSRHFRAGSGPWPHCVLSCARRLRTALGEHRPSAVQRPASRRRISCSLVIDDPEHTWFNWIASICALSLILLLALAALASRRFAVCGSTATRNRQGMLQPVACSALAATLLTLRFTLPLWTYLPKVALRAISLALDVHHCADGRLLSCLCDGKAPRLALVCRALPAQRCRLPIFRCKTRGGIQMRCPPCTTPSTTVPVSTAPTSTIPWATITRSARRSSRGQNSSCRHRRFHRTESQLPDRALVSRAETNSRRLARPSARSPATAELPRLARAAERQTVDARSHGQRQPNGDSGGTGRL